MTVYRNNTFSTFMKTLYTFH